MYAKIYINDVAVGTERTDATQTYETYSEDLSVSVGDEVQLYLKSVGTPNACYGKNFRVYGDSTYYGYGLAR